MCKFIYKIVSGFLNLIFQIDFVKYQKTKKIGELQKEMFKNIDIIPIYTEKQFMAHNKELKGFEIKKDGSYSFNDLTW